MGEQKIKPQPRYFMAVFGKEYAIKAPVKGGHYKPYGGWTNNIGIYKGDQILLYCTASYPGYCKEAPGTGEVTYVEGDTVYYDYKTLPSPVPLSIIRDCFTPIDKDKLKNIRSKWFRLFEIEPTSFQCITEKVKSAGYGSSTEQKMKYTIIIEKGRESGFVAYAPALKGCVSQGKTKEEALRNIKEAMEAYIEALLEDGLPVPTEVGKDTVELEVVAK